MLRLRTTVSLSLLALAVGTVGTLWLSRRSAEEPLRFSLASMQRARMLSVTHHAVRFTASHAHGHPGAAHHAVALTPDGVAATQQSNTLPVSMPPPELVPLSMPIDSDISYERQRGHLDGLVVLRVTIDAAGHVNAARIAQSSGDTPLDEHALRSVHAWRFAVPPDHAAGFSANLPMRFSSHSDPLASTH